MARPGLLRNRKFVRLARALDSLAFGEVKVRGLGQSLAWGSLELLWSVAYENGDDVLGGPDDVEALAAWNGPEGVLFAALRDAGLPDRPGFIEEIPERPGVWRVHDLWDHAPDYVRKRRSRESQRRAKGAELSQEPDTDRSETGRGPPNGRTRAPAPARAPAPSQEARDARDSKPASLDVCRTEWETENPATAALLHALEAAGLRLQRPRKPEVTASIEPAAAKLGAAAAALVVREQHALDPKPYLGWYATALHAAANGGPPPPKRSATAPALPSTAFTGGRRAL